MIQRTSSKGILAGGNKEQNDSGSLAVKGRDKTRLRGQSLRNERGEEEESKLRNGGDSR